MIFFPFLNFLYFIIINTLKYFFFVEFKGYSISNYGICSISLAQLLISDLNVLNDEADKISGGKWDFGNFLILKFQD